MRYLQKGETQINISHAHEGPTYSLIIRPERPILVERKWRLETFVTKHTLRLLLQEVSNEDHLGLPDTLGPGLDNCLCQHGANLLGHLNHV
jgi:hypothetical protein